ncbi:unnamed protein product, partial [Oppiella nova]
MFLMGPFRQIRTMFAKTRIIATLAVFLFMILTLMAGLWWRKVGLAIIFCILQFLAFTCTMFLMGPFRQIRTMFAKTRIIATLAVFLFMILTLMAGLWWRKVGLAIIFCILQFLAFTWY